MSQKLTASLPELMELDHQFVIEWAAVDPLTGAAVAGVTISAVGMLVTSVTAGDAEDLTAGNFTPLWLPTSTDDLNA